MLIYTIILFVVILTIFLFSSKTLSPIPYFPTQKTDLPKIIKAFNLRNNQTIIDLGAGDGIVIFKAASETLRKKLNTKFTAVEINLILILVLHIRRLFHPNKKNIKIVHDDIFKINIKNQISKIKTTNQKSKIYNNETMKQLNNVTIYLYISPWYLEKTIKNLKLKIKKFSVVSYMYPIGSLKKNEKIVQGKNKIFIYSRNR